MRCRDESGVNAKPLHRGALQTHRRRLLGLRLFKVRLNDTALKRTVAEMVDGLDRWALHAVFKLAKLTRTLLGADFLTVLPCCP